MVANQIYNILLIILIIIVAIFLTFLIISLLVKIRAFLSLKYIGDKVQKPELVKKKHFTTSDGYKLNWLGEIKEKSEIIIVGIHDLGLSSKEFDNLESYLNKNSKISLVSFDQRYFGKNDNKDEKNRKANTILSDIKEILEFLKENYTDKKVFLLGSGYGSSVSTYFVKKHGYLVDGIILSSYDTNKPYKEDFSTKRKLIMGTIFSPLDKFVKIPFEGNDFSNDKKNIQLIDNLINEKGYINVREYFQIKTLFRRAYKSNDKITVPVYLMEPKEDIFSNPQKLSNFYKGINVSNKDIIFFIDKKHSLFFDEDEKVFKKVKDWVEKNGN